MMKIPTSQDFPAIAVLRPSHNDLDSAWTPERRSAVAGRIAAQIAADTDIATGAENAVNTETAARSVAARRESLTRVAPHRISRRRAVLTSAGIAAVVAALLAVPLLVPSGSPAGPPSASALEALANAAAAQQPLGPDQYVHMVRESTGDGFLRVIETWTSADGYVWHKDSAYGASMYYTIPPGPAVSYNFSLASVLRSLPTDPDALNRYLREHVHGSNSRDEAVFVAVADMLRTGLPQPALHAAALRVLENTPHVTAKLGTDSKGRPATVVTFDDQSIRRGVTQSLYSDPETADLLESRMMSSGPDDIETVVSSGIVDSVPAEVHRYADHYTDIGTCVTEYGVQTPDVCMSRYHYHDADAASTLRVPGTSLASASVGPTK